MKNMNGKKIKTVYGTVYVKNQYDQELECFETEISLIDGGSLHDRSVWLNAKQLNELINILQEKLKGLR